MHPINIISLKKAYGNIHALRGIDLQIPEGKIYMRRQTNTINYTTELPLAQGIKFDL